MIYVYLTFHSAVPKAISAGSAEAALGSEQAKGGGEPAGRPSARLDEHRRKLVTKKNRLGTSNVLSLARQDCFSSSSVAVCAPGGPGDGPVARASRDRRLPRGTAVELRRARRRGSALGPEPP